MPPFPYSFSSPSELSEESAAEPWQGQDTALPKRIDKHLQNLGRRAERGEECGTVHMGGRNGAGEQRSREMLHHSWEPEGLALISKALLPSEGS